MNEHGFEAVRAQIENNAETTRELMKDLGYVSATLEELKLSARELEKVCYAKPEDDAAFFKASRNDGTEVRVLIKFRPDRYFAADIFSPAFGRGCRGNHDFSWDELKYQLEIAKKDPAQND